MRWLISNDGRRAYWKGRKSLENWWTFPITGKVGGPGGRPGSRDPSFLAYQMTTRTRVREASWVSESIVSPSSEICYLCKGPLSAEMHWYIPVSNAYTGKSIMVTEVALCFHGVWNSYNGCNHLHIERVITLKLQAIESVTGCTLTERIDSRSPRRGREYEILESSYWEK